LTITGAAQFAPPMANRFHGELGRVSADPNGFRPPPGLR
jgi:hypothetical protein